MGDPIRETKGNRQGSDRFETLSPVTTNYQSPIKMRRPIPETRTK